MLDPGQDSVVLPDGTSLVFRTFRTTGSPKAAVIIPSAMGVAQKFYTQFAHWLAQQGYHVTTFDYRGIGFSAPRSLRGYPVNIFDWAQDCATVIDMVKSEVPNVPLHWVGHSLGGQLLGLIPNRDRIDRVITVATGTGYWLENTWRTKSVVWWLWFIAVPLALRTAGYFPGKRLRKVGDLPFGVMQQWRRWCLNREYVVGAEGDDVRADYASVRTPMLSLSFTDDEMMSAKGIKSLHGLYANAPVEYRRIAPREIGARHIGHFGFFRPQFEQTLWPLVPQWLSVR
ncbi:alpha/beta fold hydrolase [Steroidobacter cummioxidans]|uniref:alpha/beta hydrolase family protein n=1 Tax=Steroidobacter cummioxidans TaxID=1803913 RepID=UPI000E30E62E|nr:alpha/beta fold hydrolase [Steroidobacter cummioxidans]